MSSAGSAPPSRDVRNSSTLALTTALGATAGAAQAESDPWALLSQIEIEEIVTETSYEVRKVFPADEHAAVAISGTAGLAVDMVRLFQTELEHYEKLEGSRLSLEGKANYLSRMVRGALPMAMQGLVVVPLFAGFDLADGTGRLFTFDVVGGRYEETTFGATGSGSREAKSYLRAAYGPGLDADGTVDLGLRALVAAAEQDVATSGPDFERAIMPVVVVIDADGYRELDDATVTEAARRARDEVVR